MRDKLYSFQQKIICMGQVLLQRKITYRGLGRVRGGVGGGGVMGWGGINSYSNRKSHDVEQLQRSHLSGVRGQTNDGTAFHRFRGTWPLGTELWERREKFAETVKGWTWGNIVCKNSLRKYHGSNVERIKFILDCNSPFKAKLKAFLFSQYFRPN